MRPIFLKYTGEKITSSMVTPIIIFALLDMGIVYKGTVTNFRRTAAILTAKSNPNVSQNNAEFMTIVMLTVPFAGL